MYGLGIPILFPIAAGSFLILYVIEKAMIYYSYRQPPMYDDKLNKQVLALLTWAPLLMMSFGYWMFSSRQLLSNDYLNYAERASMVRLTNHTWTEVFKSEGYGHSPALPLIIMFWILLLGTVLRGKIWGLLTKWFPTFIKVGEFEVDEDLDNYFHTLDDHDRNWSIKEEENGRNVLKLKILNDYTYDRLKQTK